MITKKNVFYILAFICIFVSACVSFELFNFKSHGCLSGIELATGNYTIQSQNITREYHLRLPDDYGTGKCYPLVIGLHGTGGHFRTFVEDEYYNIQGSVGEEAILVFPNALDNGAGVSQWDYVRDLTFFDDLYAELEETLCFDPRKVFATGHSSGAGFAQTLGCERGNILRGIVPVAGALVNNTDCIGQVAVMQIQGSKDIIVPPTMVRSSYRYWAAINSCSQDFVPAEAPYCDEFINCDENFPVQYCEHDLEEGSGHAWPDFAGPAIWDFFGSLPAAVQSEKKGTGKFFSSILGQISFKVNWPDDFTGTPVKLAIALYPPGIDYTQPVLVSPT